MSLSLITIDFWNTLVDNAGHVARGEKRMAMLKREGAEQGITINDARAREALDSGWEFFREVWLNDHRTPLPHEMVNHILEGLGIDGSTGALNRLSHQFRMGVVDDAPKLLPGVPEALEELSSKVPLGIVSDTALSGGAELRKVLEEQGVLKFFSYHSFSDETGVAKPHPRAFTTILEEVDIAPEFAIHIGDIERTDVVGARKLGMEAILFTGDHENSVIKSDVGSTTATHVAGTWDDITAHLRGRI